ILDFDVNTKVGHVSVTLSDGKKKNQNGAVTSTPLPAAFRILVATGTLIPPESVTQASFPFPNTWPKRLATLFGVRLSTTNQTKVANLAFVTVHEGNKSHVAVLDITNPLAIEKITDIDIDSSLGLAQSITSGEEGFLHLATSTDRVLID